MDFRTNLATRTYIDQKKLNIILAVIAGLLVLLLLAAIQTVSGNSDEIARLSRMAHRTRPPAQEVPAAQYQRLLTEIKLANGMIEKKTFDWIALLDSLEKAVPSGVALASVDPQINDRTLNLTGLAVKFNNIQELIRNLEDSPTFSNVYLLRQSERITPDKQRGISFSISCKWAP